MIKRLRQMRMDLGLTQTQVAERLHRYQSFVSKCEKGERRMDPIDLADFAAVYKTPIDRLIPTAAEAENQSAPIRRIAEAPQQRKGAGRKRKSGAAGSTAPQSRKRPKSSS